MIDKDRTRVKAFLEKWLGSERNERASYQSFLGDPCVALHVNGPPLKRSVEGDPGCFEKDIKCFSDKADSTKFIVQIAAQFKGRNTQKKLTTIAENLERLECFSFVISHTEG
ncbi:MAG: hypothetical protein AAGB01_10370, partial [Cyanobacteria bacterium P01_F01_bin.42]